MSQVPVLVILAGGASSRMWPLREKSLLHFGSEPLLLSQLRRYHALGLQQAIVVGNPTNADDIQQLISQMPAMQTQVVVQAEPKGMGDALLQIEPALADQPDTPIYINQVHDVVDDRLHLDMLSLFKANPAASYLAGYEMQDYFPGGYLVVNTDGRITGIVEKPGAENRPSNLVAIVAHIHQNAEALLEAIRKEYASDKPGDDHYERAMDSLMKAHNFRAVPYTGHWSALKFPWHVLDIMEYFLSQLKGQTVADDAYIAPTASLVGNVYIGPGAKVFPGAAVVGPAYIGARTIVGNNALVRNSMVLDDCNVGFTTEVARSYVANGCQMHACRVLDSVFAPQVNFSAGCTTANLRIDHGTVPSRVKGQKFDSGRDKLGAIIGQSAFLGVDVMTMPGVKIGELAQIGPGTHVHKDVLDRQRVYVRQELVVIDGE
ncbi:MAG: NTP transferase domain-containing protein [Anaerolineae bacterium]|nr:NTP transferase domain-containing protein [Anaerolineae bacterium]